ncbi:hypothetical protein MTR_1g091550 [Medicago truncatula]|uniref:Uncharacterized protein n=1 Tax=Medicago truncatula TaxID=3880 RepID=G7KIL6_MEDTR|nr:hypothetical protein MTR_1g091550 [Medicago truncatula]
MMCCPFHFGHPNEKGIELTTLNKCRSHVHTKTIQKSEAKRKQNVNCHSLRCEYNNSPWRVHWSLTALTTKELATASKYAREARYNSSDSDGVQDH